MNFMRNYKKVDVFRATNLGGHSAWTKRELLILRHLYPSAQWPQLRSALSSRTKGAIQIKAVSLNIRRIVNARTSWTGKEKDTLSKMYPTQPWAEICAAIPRHPKTAIAKMANSMKLNRDSAKKKSPHEIIRRLRAERRQRQIPTWELADIIGIHHVHLAKWERGEFVPRLRGFFDWVQALGCKLELTRVDD